MATEVHCPKCGCHSTTEHLAGGPPATVYMEYRCTACNIKFYTPSNVSYEVEYRAAG